MSPAFRTAAAPVFAGLISGIVLLKLFGSDVAMIICITVIGLVMMMAEFRGLREAHTEIEAELAKRPKPVYVGDVVTLSDGSQLTITGVANRSAEQADCVQ